MHLRTLLGFSVIVSLLGLSPLSGEEYNAELDEQSLQGMGLGIDTDSLVTFLKNRGTKSVDQETLDGLVKQLGSEKYAERQQAYRTLLSYGALSIPALREAASDPDARQRFTAAKRCLAILNSDSGGEVVLTVTRVLAARAPGKLIPLLMKILPQAESSTVLKGMQQQIINLALRQEKLPQSLITALKDPLPLRRSLALDALQSRGAKAFPKAFRDAMQDPHPMVKLKAAIALTRARDEKALITLMELLPKLPLSHAQTAEEELMSVAGERAPTTSMSETDASRQEAKDTWKKWWTALTNEKLLEELRKRTMDPNAREKATQLIQQLSDYSFDKRQAASTELRKLGASVAPVLRAQLKSKDPEVLFRLEQTINQIDADVGGPLSPTIAVLLSYRKPEGMLQAILNYLPTAESQEAHEELMLALEAAAYRDGKPAPELTSALVSKEPELRAAAAQALCQSAYPKTVEAMKKFLKDPSWDVRLQVALKLVGLQQRDAMPVLIDSLAHVDAEKSNPAEEYLLALANNKVPSGTDTGTAQAKSKAWQKWWTANSEKLQLLTIDALQRRQPFLGRILVAGSAHNQIIEYDLTGKKRWSLTGFSYPRSAVMTRNNHVVVLENNTYQITERTLRGKIVRTQTLPRNYYPIELRHIRNGNNLVTTYNNVVEYTRTGKKVFEYTRPNGDLRSARKMRDGQYVVLTSSGGVLRLNRKGKIVKQWRAYSAGSVLGYDITKKGHVLVPVKYSNRVYEYNDKGKQVWTATVQRPESIVRLPDGRTVVGSSQSPYKLYVFGRNGKQMKTISIPVRPYQLRFR